MNLFAYLMYKEEQKTIRKALENRTKVLDMIDGSYTIMGNDTIREQLLTKVDADMKSIMDYCKAQL